MSHHHERPLSHEPVPPTGAEREGLDAEDLPNLKRDPANPDAKTDVGVDETFPASDPVSSTRIEREAPPASGSGV